MRRLADRWWLAGAALFAAVLSVTLLLHGIETNRELSQQRAVQRQVVQVLRDSVYDVLSREVALARVIGAMRTPIGVRWPILADVVTGQPVASGASLIEPVTERQRASFERQTGLRLLESPAPGVVRPAAPRPLHLIVTQSTSGGSTRGLDLAVNPLRLALMLSAARTGRQVVTPPVGFLGHLGHQPVRAGGGSRRRGRQLDVRRRGFDG